jgi:hypothetical protein
LLWHLHPPLRRKAFKRYSSVDEMKLDLNLFKLGYGPIDNIPIYAVLELSGMAHRIYDSSNYIQFVCHIFICKIYKFP